jgi:hypothetical protein
LAEDLSGVYGPYRIELEGRVEDGEVVLYGPIRNGDRKVGEIGRRIFRDLLDPSSTDYGQLVVVEGLMDIPKTRFRGQGFSKAVAAELTDYYARSEVDRVEVNAQKANGGYAWARVGFTWNTDPLLLRHSLRSIEKAANKLKAQVGPDARQVLEQIAERLSPERPDLPEPIDLASLTAPGEPTLGKKLMNGTNWFGVIYLR